MGLNSNDPSIEIKNASIDLSGDNIFSGINLNQTIDYFLKNDGQLPNNGDNKVILDNIDLFLEVVLMETLGQMQDKNEIVSSNAITLGMNYEQIHNHIYSCFVRTFLRNMDFETYFKKYLKYNNSLPVFAQFIALGVMPTFIMLNKAEIVRYLGICNKICKNITDVTSLFDFFENILLLNEQNEKNEKVDSTIRGYMQGLYISNSRKFPIIYFMSLNSSNNPNEMKSSFPKEAEMYFKNRILNPRNTIKEKVGHIFQGTSETEIRYNLDKYDPIIKISNDMAISLDMTNSKPIWAYPTKGLVTGNKIRHDQLFNKYEYINIGEDDLETLIMNLHRPHLLMQIEQYLNIKFSDFPFSVQPPFLQFFAYATLDDFNRVRLLLSRANTIKEKEERLRVFLATAEQKPIIKEGEEVKKSMGELILELEENLSQTTEGKEIAQKIFRQYSDIMFLAEKNANDIKNTLIKSENNNIGFSEQTYSRELLQRANKQLREYFTILNKNKGIDNIDNSLSELEQIYTKCRVDMIQFGTLFSVTEDKEKYDLEELMKELNIKGGEKKSGTEMSEKEYDIIRQFYKEIYTIDSRLEKINTIVEEMIASDKIEEDGKKVYYSIFYYQGEPILTIRFKEQGEDIDVGAFNSPIHFQGFSFGSLVFKKMLESYSGKNIHGTVITGNENLLKFYEKFGFKVELDESGKWKKIEKDGIWFYPIKK